MFLNEKKSYLLLVADCTKIMLYVGNSLGMIVYHKDIGIGSVVCYDVSYPTAIKTHGMYSPKICY